MRDLGTLGGRDSSATAMNDLGEVAGNSSVSSGVSHAFLWDGATMRDLGTLGGATSQAWDMNEAGYVVGNSSTAISPGTGSPVPLGRDHAARSQYAGRSE